jgi:AraC family ethanolamine operon transcriptional activator
MPRPVTCDSSAPNPAPLVRSIENINEVPRLLDDFQVDPTQLDRGLFRAHVMQRRIGTARLSVVCYNRRLFQKGLPADDTVSFALCSSMLPAKWHGVPFGVDDLLTWTPGTEVDLFSEPGFAVIVASFDTVAARRVADALGCRDALRPATWSLARITKAEAVLLRDQVQRMLGHERANDGLDMKAEGRLAAPVAEAKADRLLRDFLISSVRARPNNQVRPSRRDRVVEAVLPAITRADECPQVADLCRIAETSERTLYYAFIERFGIPPARFMKLFRLNRVHAALCDAIPPASIADTANRWDFWHMGQFARDYRRLFGEAPSQTLRRGPANQTADRRTLTSRRATLTGREPRAGVATSP